MMAFHTEHVFKEGLHSFFLLDDIPFYGSYHVLFIQFISLWTFGFLLLAILNVAMNVCVQIFI